MTHLNDRSSVSGSEPGLREGLLARMVRLWIEHHHRMMECGIRPL